MFWRAIQKYGWDNFTSEILMDNLTQEEANQKEIEFISTYNSANKNYGYNLSLGGGSVNPNEETCKKISEVLKEYYSDYSHRRFGEKNPMYGKHFSEETRKKLSKAGKGRIFTEVHRKNLSISLKGKNSGKRPSEETLEKLRIASSGENNPFYGKSHTEDTKRKIRETKPCKKLYL